MIGTINAASQNIAARTLYIDASREEVIHISETKKLTIDVIEQMKSGSLRVVLRNTYDARILKAAYGNKAMIDAPRP
jgi:hypothetical protein